MLPRAGTLRERVALQAATAERDAYGEEVDTWADAPTLRASVRAERPSERLRAGRVEGQTAYVVTLRFPMPSGLVPTTAHRLVWHTAPGGPRTLAVTGVAVESTSVQLLALDI